LYDAVGSRDRLALELLYGGWWAESEVVCEDLQRERGD
jgi:hypothetical protein